MYRNTDTGTRFILQALLCSLKGRKTTFGTAAFYLLHELWAQQWWEHHTITYGTVYGCIFVLCFYCSCKAQSYDMLQSRYMYEYRRYFFGHILWILLKGSRGRNSKNYCAKKKLRFTWGWADVLSIMLNWVARPELFTLSLSCVCIERRGLGSASSDRTSGKKKLGHRCLKIPHQQLLITL